MKLRKTAVILAAVMLISASAEAAVIEKIYEETVEGENVKRVSVSGTIPESGSNNPVKNQVTLQVLFPGMTEESFDTNPRDEVVKYMAQTMCDETGKYSFDFKMDSESGKYLIRVGYLGESGDMIEKMNFDYVSPEEADELMAKVNDALENKDAAALKAVIDDFTERGILSIDKYEELKQAGKDCAGIFEYIVSLDKIESTAELNNAFLDGYTIELISESGADEDIFENEEIKSALGIPDGIIGMYNSLDESKRKEVYEAAKKNMENLQSFADSLKNGIIQKRFRGILWQEVYGAIYNNNDIFNVDFTDYEKLGDKKDYALQYFAENSGKITDIESVGALFKEAVDEAEDYEPPKTNSNGSGKGSGGGGGGSNPPVSSVITPVTPEITESIDDLVFEPPVFEDLEGVAWAKEAIEALSQNKIINGKTEGKFCPNDSIKREEFVKMVVEMFDLYGDFKTSQYIDVDDSAWYSDYIIAASENGVINGVSAYEFGIGRDIKRKDMAVVIYRVLEKNGFSLEKNGISFEDVSDDYAKEAIDGLCTAKIMNGLSEKNFAPEKSATRAEAAVLMYNVLKYMG